MKRFVIILLMLSGFFFVNSTQAQPEEINVLLYTSPDPWHNPTIPTAVTRLKELAAANNMGITWTQQESKFTDEFLSQFSVIVFLHATSSKFSPEQMECIKNFIRSGGGFVGIHGASTFGLVNEDPWYGGLVGYEFTKHPAIQTAVLKVTDKKHPATMHLPDRWVWTDEWYNFKGPLPENLHVLLTVDESTYVDEKGMGEAHPIAWYQEYDGGRSFYTALGHIEMSYNDPLFLKHLLGGIYWAATGLGILD
jgi:type 1 glutamine amidotransferase